MIRRAVILFFGLVCFIYAQFDRDPRAVGLAGAYSTVSRGYACVGWNPANLAFKESGKKTHISLGYINLRVQNSVLSIKDLNYYNGRDLERPDPYTGEIPKEGFLDLFKDDGFRGEAGLSLVFPFLSLSRGNWAVTSRLVSAADIMMPYDYADLFVNGNRILKDYDLTIDLNSVVMAVADYSMGFPVDIGAVGFSLRYFQGLAYYGFDSDGSSANFLTDTTSIKAGAEYVTRLMYGGTGGGLDLGFTSVDINGWQFSMALNNLFAQTYWNKPTYARMLLGVDEDRIYQSKKYSYNLKEITPMDFFGDSTDVMPTFDEIYMTDESRLDAPDGTVKIRYPAWIRFGLRRQLNPEVIWVSDFSASFHNVFFARDAWLWSNGIEIVRSRSFPVRAGLAWGGKNNKHISFGFSVKTWILNLDFAMALHNGFSLQTAKGFEFAMGGYLVF
jgi:hypothetical protein